jgi:sulfide:quinone oxidoreductase
MRAPALARAASSASSSTNQHKIVVIGGGTAGLAAANQVYNLFKAQGKTLAAGDIAIVDSNPNHDYQPGWTVVGSGLARKQDFRRPLDSLIPDYFAHIKDKAAAFEPGTNQVVLGGGSKVAYDYLIVAPGLQINWDKIKGLPEALAEQSSNVASIYSYETVDKTWNLIERFNPAAGAPGAVFTQPFGPVKCAGAPQKVNYMADWFWKDQGRKVPSTFVTGMPAMFAQPYYAGHLNKIREAKGISAHFNTNLVEVKKDSAVFDVIDGADKGSKVELEYGLLHVVPPMGPLDVIKSSPLADSVGWVDVDQGTLQHTKFANIFALGDGSSLPTSKTAAAITGQTPVLAHNLVTLMETGKIGNAIYDGYTSCPLFTGRGELLLAEFKYNAELAESFSAFTNQAVPNRAFYHLTKDVFPRVYFSHLVKGNWFGPRGVFPPQYL